MESDDRGRRPLRIMYIRDTLTVCGPGRTILNTLRTIDGERFNLTIAATRPRAGERNLLLDAARDLGGKTIDVGIGRGLDLVAVARLARLLRRHDIDILQTHDGPTRRIGVVAAALTGVRHITSVEGWIFNDSKQRLAKWLDQRLVRLADAAIAVSDRLRVELEEAGVPPSKIAVLRNSIRLDGGPALDPDSSLRDELGINPDTAVLAIVGRLSPEKGHDVFLRAAKIVLDERPDTIFLIVGDGPSEAAIKAIARDLGIAARVVFTGHRADVTRVYEIADALVISSSTEGLPYVLLEASTCGTPTVATAVGGIPEVIRDGETGWLVPPGDHEAIARRVLSILASPALKRQMGAAARVMVQQRFNFEHRTRALERLYRRVGG